MNLIKRIISSIVLLAVSLFCLIQGEAYFFALSTLIGAAILYEIITFKQLKLGVLRRSTLVLALSCVFVSSLTATSAWTSPLTLIIAAFVISLSGYELAKGKLLVKENRLFVALHTLLLISFTVPFAIIIRNMPNGLVYLLYILIIISLTDSAAYFVGKRFGKHKLSPISPKKTIEGSLGGTLISTLAAFFFIRTTGLDILPFLPLALSISLISQLGDIHQSLNKRSYNVKDASQLIPGHGGFYDRLDGYLFVFPYFVIVSTLLKLL